MVFNKFFVVIRRSIQVKIIQKQIKIIHSNLAKVFLGNFRTFPANERGDFPD